MLAHFAGGVEHLKGHAAGPVAFLGGYPEPELATCGLDALPGEVLLATDLFPSALTRTAKYVLPATSAFEKDGTFVNHAGLAQTFPRAVVPPREARAELQLGYDLAGKRGLAQGSAVRKEVAKTVPGLEHLAADKPAKTGKRMELATV